MGASTGTSTLIMVLVLLIGGFSKGVTGLGLPIIVIPVLANFLGLKTAVIVMSIPAMLTNVLFISKYRQAWPEMRRFWSFVLSGIIFVIIGVALLTRISQPVAALLLGVIAVFYSVTNLTGYEITIPQGKMKMAAPLLGAFAGLFHGLTGLSGPLIVAYLASIKDISRVLYFEALGVMFVIFGMEQILGYALSNLYTGSVLKMGLLASVPIFAGFYLGTRLQSRLDAGTFRQVTLLLILVSGINLLYKNIPAVFGSYRYLMGESSVAFGLPWVILALRLAAGRLFIVEGWRKLSVRTQKKERGAGGSCEPGLSLTDLFALLASYGQWIAGMMLVVGVATRWAALFLCLSTAVAALSAKWHHVHTRESRGMMGHISSTGSKLPEESMARLILAAALVFLGSGPAAVDALVRQVLTPGNLLWYIFG